VGQTGSLKETLERWTNFFAHWHAKCFAEESTDCLQVKAEE
jgi:hypothetical protein